MAVNFGESLDDLITAAYLSKDRRYKIARQLKYVKEIDVTKLLKFIEIIAEDPDSIEFSELGNSLARVFNFLDDEQIEAIISRLVEVDYGLILLGISLSISKRDMDEGILFEILRRMLTHENEKVRNAGLNLLKAKARTLNKELIGDLLTEMVNTDKKPVLQSLLTALTFLQDILPSDFHYSVLNRLILEHGSELKNELEEALQLLTRKIGKKKVLILKKLLKEVEH